MILGERLRLARKEAGLTQQQLADKVGMKKASISGLELGTSKKPSADNILPLAKFLGVTPEWLVSGKGVKKAQVSRETLPENETALLFAYRELDEKQQKLVLELAKAAKAIFL